MFFDVKKKLKQHLESKFVQVGRESKINAGPANF